MPSLYIHIPFCKNKCLFCSFVVSIGKERSIDSYLDALAQEAKAYSGTHLETVYIGGGTPTFINQTQLIRLFAIIKENFRFTFDSELTVEANPENIDFEKAKLLRDLGANRISLGVQSLSDKYLQFLGRPHNSHGAMVAFQNLRKAGFTNINLDLMFSFPSQSVAEIEDDVRRITDLQSEHLSVYTLTIEEGSRFARLNLRLENDVCQANQYARVIELLEAKGFYQYEISNFAKPGYESRHNQIYWQGGNYIGLGLGAHSHIDAERFWNVSNLSTYLSKIKENQSPVEGRERLSPGERMIETLLFGLRMTKGIEIEKIEEEFGWALPRHKRDMINEFIEEGFLIQADTCLKTTLKGRLVLDEICAKLI